MSTEGIPSPGEETASLHPCPAHTPTLCFTGFKLVFCILLYNSVSLCFSLPHPCPPSSPSPFFWIPGPCLHPCIHAPPTPQAKQCSEHHITQKEQKRNTWTSLNLNLLLKRTRVNGTCPSVWERKTGTHQTSPPNKNSTKEECILSFYILVYKPSIVNGMISFFFLKKKRRKIAIYTRLLAQGVKFTDFFNEKTHKKKATSGVFYLSTLLLCFP